MRRADERPAMPARLRALRNNCVHPCRFQSPRLRNIRCIADQLHPRRLQRRNRMRLRQAKMKARDLGCARQQHLQHRITKCRRSHLRRNRIAQPILRVVRRQGRPHRPGIVPRQIGLLMHEEIEVHRPIRPCRNFRRRSLQLLRAHHRAPERPQPARIRHRHSHRRRRSPRHRRLHHRMLDPEQRLQACCRPHEKLLHALFRRRQKVAPLAWRR